MSTPYDTQSLQAYGLRLQAARAARPARPAPVERARSRRRTSR